jgi:hypothetical protein
MVRSDVPDAGLAVTRIEYRSTMNHSARLGRGRQCIQDWKGKDEKQNETHDYASQVASISEYSMARD